MYKQLTALNSPENSGFYTFMQCLNYTYFIYSRHVTKSTLHTQKYIFLLTNTVRGVATHLENKVAINISRLLLQWL